MECLQDVLFTLILLSLQPGILTVLNSAWNSQSMNHPATPQLVFNQCFCEEQQYHLIKCYRVFKGQIGVWGETPFIVKGWGWGVL